jgi:hypothetical protein
MMMGRRQLVGSSLVVAVVVAMAAGPARASDHGTPAEITTDVSVRLRPRADAPVVQDLTTGTSVSVRARYRRWVRIGGAVRGWIPVETIDLPEQARPSRRAGSSGADADRETEALSTGSRPAAESRDENDLMMDAITAERGESPNASRIARVANEANVRTRRQAAEYAEAQRRVDAMVAEARLAESRAAIRRARVRASKARYWKDPFDDGVPRLVPSRETSTMDLAAARREVIRARTEAVAAVVDAEAARAEAAHARAEAERVRAEARQSVASGDEEDNSPRAGCRDPRPPRRAHLEEARYIPDDGAARREERERRQNRRRSMKQAMAQQQPAAQQNRAERTEPSPTAWRSTDARGIIIEPIGNPTPHPAGAVRRGLPR